MALTILSPLTGIDPERWNVSFSDFGDDAQAVVEDAKLAVQKELATDIKARTEAYILDKAGALELDIDVLVTVGEGAIPIPAGVEVLYSGSESKRLQLQTVIEEDLDISKENQRWIRRN